MPCLHLLNRTFSDSERISAKLKMLHIKTCFHKIHFSSPISLIIWGNWALTKLVMALIVGSTTFFAIDSSYKWGLVEQLRASVDFLVELCHSVSPNATRNTSLQLAALEQQKANDKMQKEKLHNKILQLDAKPRNWPTERDVKCDEAHVRWWWHIGRAKDGKSA